ncbi:MAG: SET domain-containing protein-lysine N-methyltransferase [Pseudomonadota bacterium]
MRGLITVKYRVATSTVAGAGKGFFVEEPVPAGRVLIAPTHATHTVQLAEIFSPQSHPHADTSVIWFEDHCVVSPDYPDDFFVNHSFSPNAVWHLGFTFALRDLVPGEELFLDYRHLIAPGVALEFRDGATGREIVGYPWKDSLRITAGQVLALAERL